MSNKFDNNEVNFVKISSNLSPAIDFLMKYCHIFTNVRDLPLQYDSEKIEISQILWQNGLIKAKNYT